MKEKKDKWITDLIKNYSVPKEDNRKTKILKESQIKKIVNKDG